MKPNIVEASRGEPGDKWMDFDHTRPNKLGELKSLDLVWQTLDGRQTIDGRKKKKTWTDWRRPQIKPMLNNDLAQVWPNQKIGAPLRLSHVYKNGLRKTRRLQKLEEQTETCLIGYFCTNLWTPLALAGEPSGSHRQSYSVDFQRPPRLSSERRSRWVLSTRPS